MIMIIPSGYNFNKPPPWRESVFAISKEQTKSRLAISKELCDSSPLCHFEGALRLRNLCILFSRFLPSVEMTKGGRSK